jgi:hypothetical protein
MYQAYCDAKSASLVLTKAGAPWFSIPAAFSVNGKVYAPKALTREGDTVTARTQDSCLTFRLLLVRC